MSVIVTKGTKDSASMFLLGVFILLMILLGLTA